MTLVHRLATGVALATLSLTSLAGCSGDDGAGGNDKADSDGDGKSSPEEVMVYAKELLDGTTGVKLSLSTDDDPDTAAFLRSAEGTITDQPAFDGVASGRFQGFDASDVGINSIDGTFRVDVPLAGWQEFDPSDLCAPDPALLLDPDSGVSSVLTASQGLEEGGSERGGPDNQEVLTAYTGTVPGDAITNILPCAPGDDFGAKFTINADGYLRQAELTGEFFSGAGDITYTIDINEYDVDEEISAP